MNEINRSIAEVYRIIRAQMNNSLDCLELANQIIERNRKSTENCKEIKELIKETRLKLFKAIGELC